MVALAANALTTLAVAKEALGIAVADDSQDAAVLRQVNVASQYLENACARIFGRATLEESVPGYGTDKLVLSRPPIVSVSGITYRENTVDITNLVTYAGAGMVQLRGGFQWTAHVAGGLGAMTAHGLPGTEMPDYVVSYVGGWVLPQDDGDPARDLPYDIEETCLDLIRAQWLYRTRDPAIRGEKLRTWSVQYTGNKSKDLENIAEGTVAQYRRLL